jgi:hypothetical protein
MMHGKTAPASRSRFRSPPQGQGCAPITYAILALDVVQRTPDIVQRTPEGEERLVVAVAHGNALTLPEPPSIGLFGACPQTEGGRARRIAAHRHGG